MSISNIGPCIEWKGSFTYDRNGYKRARIGNRTAARILWQRHTGKSLRRDEYVCHKCDNPMCINVDHLFVGTQKDNMMDAKNKGRPLGRPAKSHPKIKQMLELKKSGFSNYKIAKLLSLDHGTVRHHLSKHL